MNKGINNGISCNHTNGSHVTVINHVSRRNLDEYLRPGTEDFYVCFSGFVISLVGDLSLYFHYKFQLLLLQRLILMRRNYARRFRKFVYFSELEQNKETILLMPYDGAEYNRTVHI